MRIKKALLFILILCFLISSVGCFKKTNTTGWYTANKQTDGSNKNIDIEDEKNNENDSNSNIGYYIEDNYKKIGQEMTYGNYGGEDIEWLIIDADDEGLFLLSKYVIDARKYNDEFVDVYWENCSLRKWLNEEFYNQAFTDEEKTNIRETVVNNQPDGGIDTLDNVFLLDREEAVKYGLASKSAVSDGGSLVKATSYALSQGVSTFDDYYDCSWWLRSHGDWLGSANTVLYFYISQDNVDYTGGQNEGDSIMSFTHYGIRPSMWINNVNSVGSNDGRAKSPHIDDFLINGIAADTMAFLFISEEYYQYDIDGNGAGDHILLSKDGEYSLIAYATTSSVCVSLLWPMGTWEQLYYSENNGNFIVYSIPKFSKRYFDYKEQYLVFDGEKMKNDACMSVSLYDPFTGEDLDEPYYGYDIGDEAVSKSEYEAHIESYGMLFEVEENERFSIKQTDIPSDQIIEMRDKLLEKLGAHSMESLDIDLNDDGINDSVITLSVNFLDLGEVSFYLDDGIKNPEKLFNHKCTLIFLSSEEGIMIRYYDPEVAADYINKVIGN